MRPIGSSSPNPLATSTLKPDPVGSLCTDAVWAPPRRHMAIALHGAPGLQRDSLELSFILNFSIIVMQPKTIMSNLSQNQRVPEVSQKGRPGPSGPTPAQAETLHLLLQDHIQMALKISKEVVSHLFRQLVSRAEIHNKKMTS